MNVEIIPSAKRLIKSLRDIGYEFEDAVADIVDNSVEARATVVNISLVFDGENSSGDEVYFLTLRIPFLTTYSIWIATPILEFIICCP